MIQRNVWDRCVEYLGRKEIILIVGARQTGKTTLLRELLHYVKTLKEETYYFSLENPILLEHLSKNPEHIFAYCSIGALRIRKRSILLSLINMRWK